MSNEKTPQELEMEVERLRRALQKVRTMLLDNFGLFGGGNKLNNVFDHINKTLEPETDLTT